MSNFSIDIDKIYEPLKAGEYPVDWTVRYGTEIIHHPIYGTADERLLHLTLFHAKDAPVAELITQIEQYMTSKGYSLHTTSESVRGDSIESRQTLLRFERVTTLS